MSRNRKVKRMRQAKEGQLRVYYANHPEDGPDIVYHNGEGTSRSDKFLLHGFFSMKRPRIVYGHERLNNGGHPTVFEPGLVEELEKRGYDITTLEFSIMKKLPE